MAWEKGRPRNPEKLRSWKEKQERAAAQAAEAAPAQKPQGGLSWRAKVKAQSADWRDESNDNLFSLPDHVHAWLRDNNLVAQWNVETVCGQPIESLVPVGDQRRYWEAVQEGDIPDFQGVERGGCRLYVRPVTLQERAEQHRQREATSRIKVQEARLRGGDFPGVTLDSRHSSALRSNSIKHGYERVAVPGDE